MSSYYVSRDGNKAGPYDEAQIRAWLAAGTLSPQDWCWCEGMADWRPVGALFGTGMAAPPPVVAAPRVQTESLFLYVPVARLVALSILSFGVYEAYWIYKNWRYVKERDGLAITPFWRGVFGIFFCHSLLRRIHEDAESRAYRMPTFDPGSTATGWVVLRVLANLVSRLPQTAVTLAAAFIPSFLFLVPVQRYVNSVVEARTPGAPYHGWSAGQVLCLAFGIIVWPLLLLALVVGE